jgi:cobyrinic acid a,c-diamide synthase
MKSIIIAAPHSGSGKTTVTIGIMANLRRRGLKVAPFKVGPDFIDPGYHRMVTGSPSVNLDGWICSPDFIRETFALHSKNTDIAVIEGVMGLFDGMGSHGDIGSTAEIAKITGAPVLLVVDAKGQSRSVAALVKGFAEFDHEVKIAGVIFNNVASENHGRLLTKAVESIGITAIGCIPRDERLQIPSRHLGLMTVEEAPLSQEFIDYLADVVRSNVNLGMIWAAGISPWHNQQLPFGKAKPLSRKKGKVPVTIAVAHDEAFCFIYEDNLRLLAEAGAELIPFSPLRDRELPAGCSGVYLPGGYPEVHAETLAKNIELRLALRRAIADGMPVYAECGGFIFLTQGVENGNSPDARHREFVGIFPVTTRLLPKRKALGYREVELARETILGKRGMVARGHEFHYSEMVDMPPAVERTYHVRRPGTDLGEEGFILKNCLASYIHLHFGSNPKLAPAFVASCKKYKKGAAV